MSPRPERAYAKIINFIDEHGGGAFAIWELTDVTHFKYKAILSVLLTLKELGFVMKLCRGFNHKVWKATRLWTDIEEVSEAYETYKLVQR